MDVVISPGIALSSLALLGWGFGDSFIQRTSRRVGSGLALFSIAAIGSILFFPFVIGDLPRVLATKPQIWFLALTSAVGVFPAILYFEGLKRGKLTVIEPMLSLELPTTIGLSLIFRHEQITWLQAGAIALVFCGILLAITKRLPALDGSRAALERGAIFGLAAAIGLGLGNFMTGMFSQDIGPLVTVWFNRTCFAI